MIIKLKIKFEERKSKLQVLEMDESLRNKELIFRASNGWRISSVSRPQIAWSNKVIYLRGTNRNQDTCEIVDPCTKHKDIEGLEQCLNEWKESGYEIQS